MNGAKTSAIFKLRAPGPVENINHSKGLIISKIAIAGASKRIIAVASFHFGPRTTNANSSAKRMQTRVMGSASPGEQREALQEIALEANGIVLESGKCRKPQLAD